MSIRRATVRNVQSGAIYIRMELHERSSTWAISADGRNRQSEKCDGLSITCLDRAPTPADVLRANPAHRTDTFTIRGEPHRSLRLPAEPGRRHWGHVKNECRREECVGAGRPGDRVKEWLRRVFPGKQDVGRTNETNGPMHILALISGSTTEES